MFLWYKEFFLTALKIWMCYDGIQDYEVQVPTWNPEDNKTIILAATITFK